MWRPLMFGLGLAATTALGVSAAAAQGALLDDYAGPPDGEEAVIDPGAEAYAIVPLPPPVVIYVRPQCGVYHYWNGARCVDARFNPPDLD